MRPTIRTIARTATFLLAIGGITFVACREQQRMTAASDPNEASAAPSGPMASGTRSGQASEHSALPQRPLPTGAGRDEISLPGSSSNPTTATVRPGSRVALRPPEHFMWSSTSGRLPIEPALRAQPGSRVVALPPIHLGGSKALSTPPVFMSGSKSKPLPLDHLVTIPSVAATASASTSATAAVSR